MTDINRISPYIRFASRSYLTAPYEIANRVIFDYEIILLAEGQWLLTVEGKEYICKKGDVMLLKPGVTHSIKCLNNISVFQPHVHFDVTYDEYSRLRYISFASLDNMPPEDRILISKDCLEDIAGPIIRVSHPESFRSLLFYVIKAFTDKGELYQLECKEKMLALLSMVIRDNLKDMGSIHECSNPVKAIKSYIDNNYTCRITLTSLEKQFHYNKYYIVRAFNEEFFCSPISYYNSLRLEDAEKKLAQNISVTEIAAGLNFSSIYTFSRFFKEKTGQSPSEYRRSLL